MFCKYSRGKQFQYHIHVQLLFVTPILYQAVLYVGLRVVRVNLRDLKMKLLEANEKWDRTREKSRAKI